MHCAVHEIMGSRNQTGKKGLNLAKKGVKIEFSFKKKGFGSEMENPHHWKFSSQNFEQFLEYCTKISCFIDDMNYVEKNIVQMNWVKEEMDGQSWPSNVTLHKIIQNSVSFFFLFLGKKNCQCLGLFLASHELFKHIIDDMHKSKFHKILFYLFMCAI